MDIYRPTKIEEFPSDNQAGISKLLIKINNECEKYWDDPLINRMALAAIKGLIAVVPLQKNFVGKVFVKLGGGKVLYLDDCVYVEIIPYTASSGLTGSIKMRAITRDLLKVALNGLNL